MEAVTEVVTGAKTQAKKEPKRGSHNGVHNGRHNIITETIMKNITEVITAKRLREKRTLWKATPTPTPSRLRLVKNYVKSTNTACSFTQLNAPFTPGSKTSKELRSPVFIHP